MSTKTTFKRIALVAVAALGLGVLSVAPSSAAQIPGSDSLSISATSATVTVGDTASITMTHGFINNAAGDSLTAVITQQSGTAATMKVGIYITDSANAYINAGLTQPTGGLPADRYADDAATVGTANGTNTTAVLNAATTAGIEGAAGTSTSATYSVRFMAPTTVGTYVFRIYSTFATGGTAGTVASSNIPLTFTLTVAADAGLTTSATNTKTYLNRAAEYSSIPTAGGAGTLAFNTVNGSDATNALKADSALVVSAGLAASPTKVAILWGEVRNGSDTKVVSAATQTRLTDSITVLISGPGFLATSPTGLPGGSAAEGAKAKQVTINSLDSVIVYSDGTAGTATITSYKGSSVAVANVLASPKTITFTGRATTFTTTVSTKSVSGSNIGYGGAMDAVVSTGTNDSATAGTSIITFIAKDSAGNAVTDAALSVLPGMTSGAFYAVSSDTKVVRATNSATSQFLTCSYSTSKWVCSGNVVDSGTVTLTIQDSTTGTAPYSATAVSLTVAGAGYTGTIALDKATYNVGEKALITMTSKDSAGRTVGNGTSSPFGNVAWGSTNPTFGDDSSANSAGGRLTTGSLTSYLTAGGSFISGTDTVMVFMPTIAGTYTLNGTTGSSTTVGSILTFTVVDPAATAQAAATAAAKDASDAATDAALEATDAAYAATDAANIAAEAADAATAAAEAATEAANAAKESADAATAAVEELATSVAKLMAALQAQITTLAKVVAKIAVKVKA